MFVSASASTRVWAPGLYNICSTVYSVSTLRTNEALPIGVFWPPFALYIVQVYQVAGPKLLRNVLQGFNATMIAYGQTGSGKTFTMEGTPQVLRRGH